VGLAFKLAQGLIHASFPERHALLEEVLDLVAIGTIADIVPIVGENRILVCQGLRSLTKTRNQGLKALLLMGRLRKSVLSPTDIMLAINPRINVSGRLGSASTALRLLLTEDSEEAGRLARALESGNRSRRVLEAQMIREALAKLSRDVNFKEHRAIILHDDAWHPGIVGIIASRIMHQFYRPTVVIGFANGIGRGSARSIEGFHLFDALSRCQGYLDEFGGHRLACGFTLRKENLIPFSESLHRIAREELSSEDLIPVVEIDMELSLDRLHPDLLKELKRLEPFGTGNLRPVFLSRDVEIQQTGFSRGVPTLVLRHQEGRTVQANCPAGLREAVSQLPGGRADCVYRVSLKEKKETSFLELTLLDIAPSRR